MENEFRIRQETVYGGAEVPAADERGEGEGHNFTGRSDGRQLGSPHKQHTTADGGDGAEHGDDGIHGDVGGREQSADGPGGAAAKGTDGDSDEDRGSAFKDSVGTEESDGSDQVTDGEIGLGDILTGWEGEREFFLSVFRNEGRHEKMAEKNHVDRAHTVRAGLRPGAAALDLIGGMRKIFGDSDRPYDSDAEDDDIDKELRRQERAVKDGINLVM